MAVKAHKQLFRNGRKAATLCFTFSQIKDNYVVPMEIINYDSIDLAQPLLCVSLFKGVSGSQIHVFTVSPSNAGANSIFCNIRICSRNAK